MDVNKQFGYLSQGMKVPQPVKKSKFLANLLQDGKIIEFNKPFAILNMLKKTKYAHIFPRTRLKIVAMIEPA